MRVEEGALPGTAGQATTVLALGRPAFDASLQEAGERETDAATLWQRSFAAYGLAAPAKVTGTFAVGLTADDGTTFLAVDRFGTHSICYRVEGGRLRFAQRADALVGERPEIDPQAIFDYLYFHAIPSPRTIFRGVYRLPPGHVLRFRSGEVHIERWWKPEFHEQRAPDFPALRNEFRRLLAQAVERQVEGWEPDEIGCFLSGGTDSSTVAGLLAARGKGRPHTYSIGFDAAGYDEMAYARIAARHFDTVHHEYYVTPDDLVQSIPRVATHYDQPFGNSSALPAYCCARLMREDGRRLAMAGDGGDELFGGNTRYAMQSIYDWYPRSPEVLRRGLIEPLTALPGLAGLKLFKRARSFIAQASTPMPDRMQLHNLLMRLGPRDVLAPALVAAVDVGAPLAHQRDVWAQASGVSLINQMLAYDWRYTLAESDLPKVCGTTALAGVQVAFPMLDDGLADFSLGLPSNYKLRRLKLRWFFKEALRGFLPDEILAKKKHGFGLPFGVWATQHAPLKAMAQASVHAVARRGIVAPDFATRLMTTYLPAHPGYYGEMVWILMMLEQWLAHRAPDFTLGS